MKNASSDFPWRAASVCRSAALLTENICNSFDLHGLCAVSFCQKVCVEELWKRAEDNTNVLQTAEGITERFFTFLHYCSEVWTISISCHGCVVVYNQEGQIIAGQEAI